MAAFSASRTIARTFQPPSTSCLQRCVPTRPLAPVITTGRSRETLIDCGCSATAVADSLASVTFAEKLPLSAGRWLGRARRAHRDSPDQEKNSEGEQQMCVTRRFTCCDDNGPDNYHHYSAEDSQIH